jgi:hypothetical protein
MRRRALMVVVAAALLCLAATQTAFAGVAGTVSIGYNTTTESFHGKVASSNTECVAHRAVKVFKETASGPQLQGRVMSDDHGGWKLEVMHAHGHYYAVAVKQTIMTTDCARAKSRTVDVM